MTDETVREASSGLSRFAIPKDAPAPALSVGLVAAFDAAVEREHFDYEELDEDPEE